MTIRNKDTIDKQIKMAMDKAVGMALSRNVKTEYIEEIRDRVVKRTKLGIGVDLATTNSKRLKPLSENYKEARRGEARWFTNSKGQKIKVGGSSKGQKINPNKKKRKQKNKLLNKLKKLIGLGKGKGQKATKIKKRLKRLHATTTPGKSNLTATGQMLNSLSVVKGRLKGAVKYTIILGDRRGRDLYGKPSKIGNKKIARIQAREDRVFMGLTKSQINQIKREIRQKILQILK